MKYGQGHRKYHLKKMPIIIASIVLLFLIGFVIIYLALRKEPSFPVDGGVYTSSQSSSESNSMMEAVSSDIISSEALLSEPTSSIPASSQNISSEISSSKEAVSSKDIPPVSSAIPTSSEIVTSEPISSEMANSDTSSEELSADTSTGELPSGSLSDWNLILLNPEERNAITEELNIQKTKFDSQYVDSRAASAYQAMYNGAKEAGITLFLRSGYRSMKTQEVNYNANVQRLMNAGKTKEQAITETNWYYTVPGHSEHHSGLAFDIITPEYHKYVYTLNEKFAETEAYTWLVENCADYGFILRYPKEKKSITTINFEPWHYRYVGVEHAKYITENNLCLEEYIELLRQDGR